MAGTFRLGGMLLWFCFISVPPLSAAMVTSLTNASWSQPSAWSTGDVPLVADDVVIDSEITIAAGLTVEVNSLTITQNGRLIIDGGLVVNSDLTMQNNGSELITGSGASIFIFGNALLDNKVTLDLSSYFVVLGDFLRNGAGNQGTISVEGAHIYVFGTVDSSWDDFTGCQTGGYDGTTTTTGDDCDAGKLDDFINGVAPGDLPQDIYERIVDCAQKPAASLSGDAILCEEGSTASLTVELTGTSPWNITLLRDGNHAETINDITVSPFVFQVSTAGYYTLREVNDALCTGTVSGSATIVINPLPATGIIVPD